VTARTAARNGHDRAMLNGPHNTGMNHKTRRIATQFGQSFVSVRTERTFGVSLPLLADPRPEPIAVITDVGLGRTGVTVLPDVFRVNLCGMVGRAPMPG
jgi:hypothetical protein